MYELFESVLSLDILAAGVEPGSLDVGKEAPPGLGPVVRTILRWTKWLAATFGVGGIFVIAIMMMIGRRNRSQMAADGMSALPWIVGGFLLIGLASGVGETLISVGDTDVAFTEDAPAAPAATTTTP